MGCERQQQVIQASQRHGGRMADVFARKGLGSKPTVSTLLSQAACAVAPGLADTNNPSAGANETCTIVNLHTCGRSAQQLLLVPTCRPSAWQAAMMNLLESLRM